MTNWFFYGVVIGISWKNCLITSQCDTESDEIKVKIHKKIFCDDFEIKLYEITWRFYEKLFTVGGGIEILSLIPWEDKKGIKN